MNAQIIISILEDALFDYACGNSTAKQVHAVFRKYGWSVNLRGRWIGNIIEAVNPMGHYVDLRC